MSAETFHILHPHPHSRMIPLPCCFYLTEEIMADEGSISAEDLAEILRGDLVQAMEHHRARYRDLDHYDRVRDEQAERGEDEDTSE